MARAASPRHAPGAAVCLSYFIISTLPARYETNARLLDVRMPKAVLDPPSPIASEPTEIDRPPTGEEVAAAIFRKAAEEILRRAPNTSASAFADDLPIAGRIPLPRSARSHEVGRKHLAPPRCLDLTRSRPFGRRIRLVLACSHGRLGLRAVAGPSLRDRRPERGCLPMSISELYEAFAVFGQRTQECRRSASI